MIQRRKQRENHANALLKRKQTEVEMLAESSLPRSHNNHAQGHTEGLTHLQWQGPAPPQGEGQPQGGWGSGQVVGSAVTHLGHH